MNYLLQSFYNKLSIERTCDFVIDGLEYFGESATYPEPTLRNRDIVLKEEWLDTSQLLREIAH